MDFISRITMIQAINFGKYKYCRICRKVENSGTTAGELQELRLEVLIGHSLPAKASDIRDRVFALLSIAATGNGCQFQVDYSQNPEEVYANLARFCLIDRKPPLLHSCSLRLDRRSTAGNDDCRSIHQTKTVSEITLSMYSVPVAATGASRDSLIRYVSMINEHILVLLLTDLALWISI